MHLAQLFLRIWRDLVDKGLKGGNEIRVKGGDQRVV